MGPSSDEFQVDPSNNCPFNILNHIVSLSFKKFNRTPVYTDNIQLTSTKEFDNSVVHTYESILKPVFINVVNNAVYRLASADKKTIHLTYEEDSYLIMNSGQPIDGVYIKEDIFKLFFSRKPKGRGIGLYLAKTTLNSIGFDIIASNDKKYNRLNGACFIIRKVK